MQGSISPNVAVTAFITQRRTLRLSRVLWRGPHILPEIHTSPYIHHNADDRTFSAFYLMSDLAKTKCSPNPDSQNLEKEEFIGYMGRVTDKLMVLPVFYSF